jgi:hypothetical protein
MSMSLHVEGFIPPDAKFQKMFEVYRACEKAGVDIPAEVDEFFNGETPDAAGVRVSLTSAKSDGESMYKDAVKEYEGDEGMGYDVDLRKLPADIKILRFLYCR